MILLWIPTTAQQHLFDAQLLTTDDGLANLMTTAIHQDRKDYLWIGNNRGLNRYDGYGFQLYTKEKYGLQSSDNIKDIQEDEQGNLWLFYKEGLRTAPSGTPISGIDIFDTRLDTALSFEAYIGNDGPFLSNDVTLPKIIDPQNRLWISTLQGELFVWEGGGFIKMFEKKGAVFKYISADANDHIWLGWDKEVVCLNQSGDVLEKILLPHTIHGIWLDSDGTVWLAVHKTEDEEESLNFSFLYKRKGKAKLEPFNLKKDALIEDLKEVTGSYIHRDEKGYWYTNFNGGLNLYDPNGEWIGNFVSQLGSISNFGCMNNFEVNGNLWWGSPSGVLKTNVKKNPFQLIHKKQERFSDCRGITEDEYGNIYFLNSKAYRWNPQQKLLENLTPDTERTFTYSLMYKDGKVWAGTWHGYDLGVQIDLGSGIETGFGGINGERPYSLLESDDANKYWVGTEQGIEYIDFNLQKVLPFDHYQPDDSRADLLKKSTVYHLHKNGSGIWAATSNGVFLLREKEGILRHYTTPSDLPYVGKINFIHEDNKGLFWLATSEGGVVQWQPSLDEKSASTFRQFTTEEGLSNNATYAIYEDSDHRLWIPSDKGIMCLDKETNEVKTFLTQDGLPHNEFNLTSHYQAKDGTIYLGGLGGLISFHPREFRKSFIDQTPLQIIDYRLLEEGAEQMADQTRRLKETNEIILSPSDKLFELRFVLMDYDKKENHRYAYQIEGYHDHWQFIEDNYIRINTLPYGNYLLKIKGKNINTDWSENELTIKIKVLTPFYLKWWFITILLLLAFGGAVVFVRRREQLLQKDKERLEIEVQKRTLTIQQQAEELKALDKAKTRFFSNITHEIRTPLTLIIGPLEQLLEEQVNLLIRQRLFGIFKNARQLLTLINQLLDLSKLEGKRMRIEISRGDIAEYTHELILRFQSLAENKNQKLNFISDQNQWKTNFDKNKWSKIIHNLVSNAIKFTPKGGTIEVQLRKVEMEENEAIQLIVKDTGIGMDEEALNQIFNRFYQVDNSSTRVQGGTGIGLSLVKELVELQGGTITAKSEVETGTAFEIELPVLKKDTSSNSISFSEEKFLPAILEESTFMPAQTEENVTLTPSPNDEKDKLTLLLIEDNDEMRAYIRQCLDESIYQILEAGDGEEGIDHALTHVPDLIISDVMMPKKNGFEVVRSIRSNLVTSHIPVILLTAKASLESRLEGLKRGADAYLTKPFSPQELALRIQKLIEIRRMLQARYRDNSDLTQADTGQFEQEDAFIIELKTFITNNLSDSEFSGKMIGKHFGVSRTALYHKIKALTGQAISEYIRSVRLEVAYNLIREGKLNLSEIAYETGFSSLSHFSRTFKKAYRKAPSEIQRKI